MGLGGISPIQLLIILVIVLLIFGTKKLRNFGGDLGGAIKGFKKAVKDDGDAANKEEQAEIAEKTAENTAEKAAGEAGAEKAKTEEKQS